MGKTIALMGQIPSTPWNVSSVSVSGVELGFFGFSSVDNVFAKKYSLELIETSHQIKKKGKGKKTVNIKTFSFSVFKTKFHIFASKQLITAQDITFVKKLKHNPRSEYFILVWKDLFICFNFSFFHSTEKMEKIISGHPYIFSYIFQFSLQTEKPGGHSLLGSLLSLFLSESDLNQRKGGSSFQQVIPTRIKVFRRCKNTENGRSHGCLQGAEQDPGDRSPGSKEHCHLQFPAMPSYFHIRQFINCGSDPAFSEPDWDVLTPLICEQCKIQVIHPNLLWARGLGGFGVGGSKWRETQHSPHQQHWSITHVTWKQHPFFAECYHFCRDNTVLDSCSASSIKWKGLTRIFVGIVIWFKHSRGQQQQKPHNKLGISTAFLMA